MIDINKIIRCEEDREVLEALAQLYFDSLEKSKETIFSVSQIEDRVINLTPMETLIVLSWLERNGIIQSLDNSYKKIKKSRRPALASYYVKRHLRFVLTPFGKLVCSKLRGDKNEFGEGNIFWKV